MTGDPEPFRFEPDVSGASTLPASWYRDPEILRGERDRVFARTWQLVGRAEQVARAGDYFTAEVAGEPLVIARGDDGAIRAFSNVCRHRAGPVARGAGNRRAFRCGYHGWTYRLDGRLQSTPEWEGVRDFDPASNGLPPARVEAWGPFLFVCLDPAAPALSAALSAIGRETAHLPLARMRLVKAVDYEIACNWKVYVDNYVEGYHIPIVHPELFRLLDYGAYAVETAAGYSKQHAPIRTSEAKPAATEAFYYWVFPNLMLNLYPDNLQTNLVLPLSPERTVTRFEWYLLEPERTGASEEFARSFALAEQVQREDVAICEAVQKGLGSRTYDRGRYSVRRENGVHHFHGLLAAAMKA